MNNPIYKYTVNMEGLDSVNFSIDYFANYVDDVEMSLGIMVDGICFESDIEEHSLTII